ncbi:DUF3068 domain-containing protein [Corynebacterium sp. UBA2622]|uniref:DUF3068 domain-containing protein n=1 Tax=Corynebacterium sp. UBA2622 TaxID=1946393 RepID=UPI0025BCB68E|nr:DUF3068 domain-containing protein [Corynebacterium sp. UBA2622]
MLPTSRILSALLTGLGIALVVGGLIAPRFLVGDGRLPLSLEDTTWTMTDPQGKYLGRTAPVTRQLHMEIQDPSDEDTASVRVGDTLRAGEAGSDFDNLVSAATWSYVMDRRSGEPQGDMHLQTVMATPAVDVANGGSWLKLPSDVEQKTYTVFDPTLRSGAAADFTGEEDIKGRSVYTFEQRINPTNVAMAYADMRNTKTIQGPDGQQIRAFLFHSAQRRLLVDQISGLVVGMDEKVDDYYGDAQGRRLEDYVAYDAHMPRERVESMTDQLGSVRSADQSRAVRYGVIGLGTLLTLAGLVGTLRPGGRPGKTAGRRGGGSRGAAGRAVPARRDRGARSMRRRGKGGGSTAVSFAE